MSDYINKPWLKNYPPSVPENIPPHSFTSIADCISKCSEKYKDSIAYTTCLPNGLHSSLTFTQVEEYSNNLAAFFIHELGLKKGDRVALQMPNCQTYPIAIFAIFKAALIVVNLNPLYTESETEYALKDSGAKAIIIIDLFAQKLKDIIGTTSIKNVIICSISDFFPLTTRSLIYFKQKYIDKTVQPVNYPFIKIRKAVALPKKNKRLDSKPWLSTPGDLNDKEVNSWVNLENSACLQYTGGTTGKSKGAELTHANILSNMLQITEYTKANVAIGKETVLTALPLYHIFSFTVNCLFFYSAGAQNILIPSPKPLLNLKKAFEKFTITWITGVNTLFHGLVESKWFKNNPPKKLKFAIAGGMPLLSSTAEKWKNICGGDIVEGYGLTETSPLITVNTIGGGVTEKGIGLPVCSTQVKLVDLNDQEVSQGEPGELCVKGPQVMLRYWQNPKETEQAIKDGWFYTGDIAIMDKNGYFKIVDRKKDMILVGGFNVYPNEIEDCIQKIESVLECAVVGILDEARGELVKAFVVSNDSSLKAENVISHCKKYLTAYKVPKLVEFKAELPKSPVGKILKRELKKS